MRDEKGRLLPGQPPLNPAGKPKGTIDGIRILRKFLGDEAAALVDSGLARQTFEELRETQAGRLYLLKMLTPFMRDLDLPREVIRIDIGIVPRTELPPGYDPLPELPEE
jgi:hypothetical protein